MVDHQQIYAAQTSCASLMGELKVIEFGILLVLHAMVVAQ